MLWSSFLGTDITERNKKSTVAKVSRLRLPLHFSWIFPSSRWPESCSKVLRWSVGIEPALKSLYLKRASHSFLKNTYAYTMKKIANFRCNSVKKLPIFVTSQEKNSNFFCKSMKKMCPVRHTQSGQRRGKPVKMSVYKIDQENKKKTSGNCECIRDQLISLHASNRNQATAIPR